MPELDRRKLLPSKGKVRISPQPESGPALYPSNGGGAYAGLSSERSARLTREKSSWTMSWTKMNSQVGPRERSMRTMKLVRAFQSPFPTRAHRFSQGDCTHSCTNSSLRRSSMNSSLHHHRLYLQAPHLAFSLHDLHSCHHCHRASCFALHTMYA